MDTPTLDADGKPAVYKGRVERWVVRLECGFIIPEDEVLKEANHGNNLKTWLKDVREEDRPLKKGDIVSFEIVEDTTTESIHVRRPYKATAVTRLQHAPSKKGKGKEGMEDSAEDVSDLVVDLLKEAEASTYSYDKWKQVRGFSNPWAHAKIDGNCNFGGVPTWEPRPSSVKGTPLQVVVGCSFAADELESPLKAWLEGVVGLPCNLEWVPYGGMVRELSRDPSRYLINQVARSANLLVLRLEDLAQPHPELQTGRQLLMGLKNGVDTFSGTLLKMASQTIGPTIVIVCPYMPETYADPNLREVFTWAEGRLVGSLQSATNVHPVASQCLMEEYTWMGPYFDAPMNRLAHSPYTPSMCAVIGCVSARMLHRLVTIGRKVVVLDCDNTLWGGAVGELGPEGVTLDPHFVALQQFMAELQRQGILLCLCSKNIQSDVEAVFTQRAIEMAFSLKDVVGLAIGWGPKSEGVKRLAESLSLGLDSFVFVDDNPVECSEVHNNTDGLVTVVQLPTNPQCFPSYLRHHWAFDRPLTVPRELTEEDRKRTEQYKANAERDTLLKKSGGFGAFLGSLELNMEIDKVNRDTIGRVAQLTERTNQFNPFKWVLNQSQMENYVKNHGSVWTVTVTDRFGHYGLVGVLMVANEGPANPPHDWPTPPNLDNALFIDGFLLSCRVLHRGVEHAMMRQAATVARQRVRQPIAVRWAPSERNEPARKFLFEACKAECVSAGGVEASAQEFPEGYAIIDVEHACTLSVRDIAHAVAEPNQSSTTDKNSNEKVATNTKPLPVEDQISEKNGENSQVRMARETGSTLSLHWETYNSIACLLSTNQTEASTQIRLIADAVGGEQLAAMRKLKEESIARALDTSESDDPVKRQQKDCKFRRQARHGIKLLVDSANHGNETFVAPTAPPGADNTYI